MTWKKFALLLVASTLLFFACKKNSTCYQPKDVRAQINMVVKEVLKIDSLRDTVIVDTTIISYRDTAILQLSALTLDVDSPIQIYAVPRSSRIGLLLNPNTDSIRYRLAYDTTSTNYDTIVLYYKPKLQFINNSCGYTYYYTLDRAGLRSAQLDSFSLPNPSVTKDVNVRNLNLYFF